MPTGWTSNMVISTTWRTDSSNSSNGYTNATGLNNMLIRNTDPSGTYILTSPDFSTIGYKNILVSWASRVSTNYLTSGSTTPIFEYSIDGGLTWQAITYTENPANSVWVPVNGGLDIALPANTENQMHLQFRWTITIVNNPNGTYRMDDFNLKGDLQSGLNAYSNDKTFTLYPNPANEKLTIKSNIERQQAYTISITDLTGKQLQTVQSSVFPIALSTLHLAKGNYVLTLTGHTTKEKNSIPFQIN